MNRIGQIDNLLLLMEQGTAYLKSQSEKKMYILIYFSIKIANKSN